MVTAIRNCRRIHRCKSTPPPFLNKHQTLTPPKKTIDSVLRSAAAEKEEDEDFENRWTLMQQPSQTLVAKPSVAPVGAFQSGFVDASTETLRQFVSSRCGENGLGHDGKIYMDWLADDAFGVVNARTAEDDTVLFCVRETVDAIQEAEVRLAWDKGLKFHVPCAC
jgi:hypothetical protein